MTKLFRSSARLSLNGSHQTACTHMGCDWQRPGNTGDCCRHALISISLNSHMNLSTVAISNGHITLLEVVKALGEYLTSEEDEVRTKGDRLFRDVDFCRSYLFLKVLNFWLLFLGNALVTG
jgi:hypothetical protein